MKTRGANTIPRRRWFLAAGLTAVFLPHPLPAARATLLLSFERRRDWSLTYPAKLTLRVL